MAWFNFNSKEREYNVTISSVAKEFGIEISFINTILRDAGYNPKYLAHTKLTDKHLSIILLAYAHSIKSYYKEVSKNFNNYSLKEQQELRDFFGKFIRKSFFKPEPRITINDRILLARNGKIFNAELDNEVISDYFFKTIRNLEIKEEIASYQIELCQEIAELLSNGISLEDNKQPTFIHREITWRTVQIKPTYTDIKSRIFTTIISGHYYIFSAEEDSDTALLSSITRCFSAVQKTLGEAFKNINLKSAPEWKIILNPL